MKSRILDLIEHEDIYSFLKGKAGEREGDELDTQAFDL
jgi:hypothetical protein